MRATLKQGKKFLSIFEDTPAEQMQEILESGLLADLRVGNIAEVNRGEFRKILGLKPLTPEPQPLLEYVGTATFPATAEKFIASDRFVVNTGEGARPKIYHVGEYFQKRFFGKTEEPTGGAAIHYHELCRPSEDGPIFVEFGGKEKTATTLAAIFSLMEKQGNGEPDGDLLTDGRANIFYVPDAAGVVRAVFVHWYGYGWVVFADSVESPDEWRAGYRVFSRNCLAA